MEGLLYFDLMKGMNKEKRSGEWMETIEIKESNSLQRQEIADLITFAKKVSTAQECYLQERFLLYGHVIILKRKDKVGCFQFIEYLYGDDEIFIYFGPLFSNRGRFLAMFLDFFQQLVGETKGKKLHLLAEIQNPEVFLVFKALFGLYSYPHIHQTIIPSDVKRIATFFASKLSHMSNVNLENLSTISKVTLYSPKPQLNDVSNWLLKRGIDAAQGDNVLLLVTVPIEQSEREELLKQLDYGIALTKNWKEGKQVILRQFQEGV